LRALEASFGARLKGTPLRSRREGSLLAGLLGVVVLGGGILVTAALVAVDPLGNSPGRAIAHQLVTVARPLRIWNAYNVSGSLIAFGGGREGHLRLVIDGRSDLWGGPYIARTVGTERLTGDWQQTFNDFHADAVVLPRDAPLVTYLQQAQHWRLAQSDRGYVLLRPPNGAL
jgi:hypothetical protein